MSRARTLTPQVRAAVKRVALQNCETKRISSYEEGVNLFHNVTQYRGGLLDTKHGFDNPDGANATWAGRDGSRIGAEIIARGISFKFYLERQNSNATSHFKIVVFRYKQGEVLSDALIWQSANGDGGNNVLRIIDTVDTSNVKILKQLVVRPNSQLTSTHQFYLNLHNMKVKYPSGYGATAGTGYTVPDTFNIGFAVVGCDKIGNATTDQIGELNFAWKMTFKDP